MYFTQAMSNDVISGGKTNSLSRAINIVSHTIFYWDSNAQDKYVIKSLSRSVNTEKSKSSLPWKLIRPQRKIQIAEDKSLFFCTAANWSSVSLVFVEIAYHGSMYW